MLKCPRCPRTELDLDRLNQEITLADFQRGFPVDTLEQINLMIFCGDIGDPIYATEFLEIVEYIKQNSHTRLRIVTNGSYKKPEWWTRLGHALDYNDMITFSVDGWDDASNQQYRVNSNFDSIVAGVRALREASDCLVRWSTIYFSFNQDHVDRIRDLARELGCNWFQTVKSSKFNGRYMKNQQDLLKPRAELVASTLIYDTNIEVINPTKYEPIPVPAPMSGHDWARCLNFQKELFIGIDGIVSPCPWFNNGYQNNDFITENHSRLSIHHRSFLEIVRDRELWQTLLDSFDQAPLEICRMKCKNGQQ